MARFNRLNRRISFRLWWEIFKLFFGNSSSSVMKKSSQPPPLTNTEKNFHSNSGLLSPKTPTSANIEDTETWETDKRFTVYKVYIQSQGKSWFLFRRYNEFYRLYEIVKKIYPNSQLKLPGKRILGNNFDPSFIKARKEGLSEFIDQLLSDPRFIQITEVRTFLGLDNPKNLQDNSVDIEDDDKKDSFEMPDDKVNLGPTEKPHGKPSDFEFLKVIGKGSFGKVLVAKHKLENRIYAIKVLQKQQIMKRNEAKHIMSERNVLLKNLSHPFLVGLHYSFQTRDKLYFVLDYVNGGELFFHLQRERFFSEPRAQFYSAEIGCAIGYLHSQHIVYRDLKPENLLLDSEGHIVLTDFGLCKEGIEATGTTTTFCGTPEYLAPEVLKKLPYDRTVDWWCLGAVLYEMLYGLPPFYSRDTAEMYDNILHKPLRLRSNVSVAARHILERLLDKDLHKRLGAGENDFLDVKNHDFYHSINWEDLEARKIRPPYNPNVSGNLDLKHFDPEFIREPVPASLAKSSGQALISASVQDAADEAFIGFSYAPPLEEEMF